MTDINTVSFPNLPFFNEPVTMKKIALSIGSLEIRWYGVIIAFGTLLAIIYTLKRCKHFGITEDNMLDVLLWALPSGIIGARLYFVVSKWDYYGENPGDIIKVWNGGLAILGGVILGILVAVIYCRIKKVDTLSLLDTAATGIFIGQIVGRWANFVNAECFGTETDLPWGMSINGQPPVHPCFLYESLWNLAGFIFLHFYLKKRKFRGEGILLYAAWYGLGRGWIEGLRTDSLYIAGTDLRKSQVYSIIMFVAATCLLIYNYIKLRKKSKA